MDMFLALALAALVASGVLGFSLASLFNVNAYDKGYADGARDGWGRRHQARPTVRESDAERPAGKGW